MLRAKCVLALVALMLLVISHPAAGQSSAGKQFYVVTYVDAFPNFAGETAKLLQQFAENSRKDPGCVRFEVMRDVERTNEFTIVEAWQNRQAYDAHLTLAHTKSFLEKIKPGLGSPFDERYYSMLQ